jgi:hypothetical protein
MSFVKAVPKGLEWIEYEHGVGGKNSTMCYIPKQDLVQDALKKNRKTMYFKLTVTNMVNELKVAIWASRTPEQFLLDVHTVIPACNQMGLDANLPRPRRLLRLPSKMQLRVAMVGADLDVATGKAGIVGDMDS